MGDVAELLGSVLDEITEDTWLQHVLDDGHGRYCAYGWLAHKRFGRTWQKIDWSDPIIQDASNALAESIGDRPTYSWSQAVMDYNNTRSYEDVVLMFKRGYELALERGL